MTLTLYDHPFSGNCYKIRLFLSLNGVDCARRTVDMQGGENRSTPFLSLNPLGQIPVLIDDDFVLRDSQAILVYLAETRASAMAGQTPAERGLIAQWLSFAAKEMAIGPQAARLHHVLGRPMDIEAITRDGMRSLAVLDAALAERSWLVADRLTIADIACMPYTVLAPEGGLPLDGFPNLRAWIARLEGQPGFVGMNG